jgi:hypothetical protein
MSGLRDCSTKTKEGFKAHIKEKIVRLLELYSLRKTREDVLGVSFEIKYRNSLDARKILFQSLDISLTVKRIQAK